ncbi:MAG TPA: deoxyhypusine synthase family protein [Polyangiaceae bacterium]|nr:deoxyhypusine synthase family protein [Polyangiaceae bacterium]
MGAVRDFVIQNFRHFNAAALVDAARGWEQHLAKGGKMVLTLGGAMSTAEIGIVLADLIRKDKVHGLSVTGANLEEDVFNLVAHKSYCRVPNFRELGPAEEKALFDRGLNRVTDTCIPEHEAMRKIEKHMLALWVEAQKKGERAFPHEYFYKLLRSGVLTSEYQIDPRHSWLLAAAEKNLPIWVPGWEDSTLGNMFVAGVMRGLYQYSIMKTGLEYMGSLINWYKETDARHSLGFFQIGGGITGDFPICVVPLMNQDLGWEARTWGYFCQISEARASYGSYSGAPPSEKITWGKLSVDTPRFVIESDATIVFPLIAAYLLEY